MAVGATLLIAFIVLLLSVIFLRWVLQERPNRPARRSLPELNAIIPPPCEAAESPDSVISTPVNPKPGAEPTMESESPLLSTSSTTGPEPLELVDANPGVSGDSSPSSNVGIGNIDCVVQESSPVGFRPRFDDERPNQLAISSSCNRTICCSGAFSEVSCHVESESGWALSDSTSLPLKEYCRCCAIPGGGDSLDQQMVAVGGWRSHPSKDFRPVVVCNVDSSSCVSVFRENFENVLAIASAVVGPFESPRVLSGSDSVFVSSLNGRFISKAEEFNDYHALRMVVVSQWESSLIVAGVRSIYQFDLNGADVRLTGKFLGGDLRRPEGIAVSTLRNEVVSVNYHKKGQVWSSKNRNLIHEFELSSHSTCCCCWENLLFVGMHDGTIGVWDLRGDMDQRLDLFSPTERRAHIWDLHQLADNRFVSGGNNHRITAWNSRGTAVHECQLPGAVRGICVLGDGDDSENSLGNPPEPQSDICSGDDDAAITEDEESSSSGDDAMFVFGVFVCEDVLGVVFSFCSIGTLCTMRSSSRALQNRTSRLVYRARNKFYQNQMHRLAEALALDAVRPVKLLEGPTGFSSPPYRRDFRQFRNRDSARKALNGLFPEREGFWTGSLCSWITGDKKAWRRKNPSNAISRRLFPFVWVGPSLESTLADFVGDTLIPALNIWVGGFYDVRLLAVLLVVAKKYPRIVRKFHRRVEALEITGDEHRSPEHGGCQLFNKAVERILKKIS